MTVSFLAAGSGIAQSNASIIVPAPSSSSYAVGDLLLIFASYRTNVKTINTPAGWTLLFTWDGQHVLFGKIADGVQASVTVALTGSGGSGSTFEGQMAALRSTVGWPALASIVSASSTSSDTAINVSTPALSIASDAFVVFLGNHLDDLTSATPPVGSTLITAYPSTLGDDMSIMWAYKSASAGSNISADSFTIAGSTSVANFAATIALSDSGISSVQNVRVSTNTPANMYVGLSIVSVAYIGTTKILG